MTVSVMLGTISLNNIAGGLQKNIIYLANNLVNEGHKVVLLSFDLEKAQPFFEIDKRVVWIKAGVSMPHSPVTFTQRLQIIKKIRSAMIDYDIRKVVLFSHGLLARFLTAGLGLGADFICSERNSLAMYGFIRQSKWNLNFLLLALVKQITVQFEEYCNDYPFWLRHKILVIHNPVFTPSDFSDLSQNRILMVGRLTAQKRFDLAIHAFKILLDKQPDWQLRIVGEGPLKKHLNELIDVLDVKNSVSILSPKKSIESHYLNSSIFLITSQWEGFPNALAEAMSHGLIAVGLAETAGVPNLITKGETGILMCGPISGDGLARTIIKTVANKDSWDYLSNNSKKITRRFSGHEWVQRWLCLLA